MSAAELLARSASLRLVVMLRRTVRPSLIADKLVAHLAWMIEAEKAGHIFLSGPVTPREGGTKLNGLTILHVASLDEAERLAQQDPLVTAGIVTFELFEWTVNEGAIPLTLTLSDSTVRVG